MLKRPLVGSPSPPRISKRSKLGVDRLSLLSDELLLRVLSNSSVQALVVCQRVSRRLYIIAGDAQLWKAAYYNRFVKPRARRARGTQGLASAPGRLNYSSRLSVWLGEEKLVRLGSDINWKSRYKLANNWSKGNCDISKITLAGQRSVPSLLARLQNGVVFTVDSTFGLRAWAYKKDKKMLASVSPAQIATGSTHINIVPTSLSVDTEDSRSPEQKLVIGFKDGSYSCFGYEAKASKFRLLYVHQGSPPGALSGTALAWPYILTMTMNHRLSIYMLREKDLDKHGRMAPALLLQSFQAHAVSSPFSLSVRLGEIGPIISLAFCQATYLSGWSTCVQEIWISPEGNVTDSRLASACSCQTKPTFTELQDPDSQRGPRKLNIYHATSCTKNHQGSVVYSKPTSLSYSHPYLLVSHADSTLSLHLVTTTSSSLSITGGKRLWGHTSSISGAYVAGRGKAVSVSVCGGELRVWELEGSLSCHNSSTLSTTKSPSVRVTRDDTSRSSIAESTAKSWSNLEIDSPKCVSAFDDRFDDHDVALGWVEFDDESVVVLRENQRGTGSEALLVYDFT